MKKTIFQQANPSEYLKKFKKGINKDIVELINMLICSKLITRSALARKESRGTHFIKDYPVRNDKKWMKHSIIDKKRIKFIK